MFNRGIRKYLAVVPKDGYGAMIDVFEKSFYKSFFVGDLKPTKARRKHFWVVSLKKAVKIVKSLGTPRTFIVPSHLVEVVDFLKQNGIEPNSPTKPL